MATRNRYEVAEEGGNIVESHEREEIFDDRDGVPVRMSIPGGRGRYSGYRSDQVVHVKAPYMEGLKV